MPARDVAQFFPLTPTLSPTNADDAESTQELLGCRSGAALDLAYGKTHSLFGLV